MKNNELETTSLSEKIHLQCSDEKIISNGHYSEDQNDEISHGDENKSGKSDVSYEHEKSINEWEEYFAKAPLGWESYWEANGDTLIWHSWCNDFSQIYSEILKNSQLIDHHQENDSTNMEIKDCENDPQSATVELIDWNKPVWSERYQRYYWEKICYFLEEYKKTNQSKLLIKIISIIFLIYFF